MDAEQGWQQISSPIWRGERYSERRYYKWHYFGETHLSLCGLWWEDVEYALHPDWPADHKDNCKRCASRLVERALTVKS